MKFLAGTTLAIYSLSSAISAQDEAVDPCADLSTSESLADCVSSIVDDLRRFQNGRVSNRFRNKMSEMIGEEVVERTSAMMDEVDTKLAGVAGNGPDMDVNGNVYISYGSSTGSDDDSEASEVPVYDAAAHLADQEAGLRDYWDFDDMPNETVKEIMLQRFFEKQSCTNEIFTITDYELFHKFDFGVTTDDVFNDFAWLEGYGVEHDALLAHWSNITEPLGPGWRLSNVDEFMAAYGEAWANDWIENSSGPLSFNMKDEYVEYWSYFEPYSHHSQYVYCIALPNMIRPNKFEHDPWHPSILGSIEEFDLLDDIAHSRFFEYEQCNGQVYELYLNEISDLFALSIYDEVKSNAIKEHWAEVLSDKTELFGNWFADSDWIDFYEEHGRAWANDWVTGWLTGEVSQHLYKQELQTVMAFGFPYYTWMQYKYCVILPNVLRVSNLKHGIEYSEGDYIMGQETIHALNESIPAFN